VNVEAQQYLSNWPGWYRVPINKVVGQLQQDKAFNEVVKENHIDRRTWMTFTANVRRRLVKSPVQTLGSKKDFVHFCTLLDAASVISSGETRFDTFRNMDGKSKSDTSTNAAATVGAVGTSGDVKAEDTGKCKGKGKGKGKSKGKCKGKGNEKDGTGVGGPSVLASTTGASEKQVGAQRELLQFLFDHTFRMASTELEDTITSYKALSNISDLRLPHEWYPHARLMKRKIIYHGGPTNSGKTYHALKRLQGADPAKGGGLYCGPLRLLALEVYESLNQEGILTNLLTGQERRETPFATHVSSTLEMVTLQREFDVAVIDEIQMIGHHQRGYAWTRALHGLRAREIHVCGGLEALNIVKNLAAETGDDFELIEYDRLSKLEINEESLQGDYSNIQPGDCVVAFSRAEIFSIRREIERLTPYKCCMVYGQLPPETRSTQARLFNEENTGFDVLVASDAIGMGLNLNIGRIVFHTTVKKGRTPKDAHFLDPTSVKQIAGRAGRLSSKYAVGKVTAWQDADLAYIKSVMDWEIPQLDEAGLFPSVEQVEAFSEKLRNVSPTGGGGSSSSGDSDDKGKGKGGRYGDEGFGSGHAKGANGSSSSGIGAGADEKLPMSQSETTKISALMTRFVELAKMDGRYHLSDHEDMVTVANWLHTIPLSLADRFIFANAPVNTSSTLGMNLLYQFAATYAQQRPVGTNVRINREAPTEVKEFVELCFKHNALDLYLWLSVRFPKYFVARDTCLEQKSYAISLIEQCLHRSSLTQSFSHSEEYQTTRSRLGGDGLPPEEWNHGQVRESARLHMSRMDPANLYLFPHAEAEAVEREKDDGRNQKGGKGARGGSRNGRGGSDKEKGKDKASGGSGGKCTERDKDLKSGQDKAAEGGHKKRAKKFIRGDDTSISTSANAGASASASPGASASAIDKSTHEHDVYVAATAALEPPPPLSAEPLWTEPKISPAITTATMDKFMHKPEPEAESLRTANLHAIDDLDVSAILYEAEK
jgi:ATP-dependent RNA helicase SUPV3L1/SUV3